MRFRKEPTWETYGYSFEQVDPGYWLGIIRKFGVDIHIELVEVRKNTTNALNSMYQNRIEAWLQRNDGCQPQTVLLDNREFFLGLEVYAK